MPAPDCYSCQHADDTPLAEMYGWHRAMRLFDGPDDVHLMTLARSELRKDPLFRF